jgi:hypothetical protein
MGCWNGTCGLTNLPIMAGEPTVFHLVGVFGHGGGMNPAIDVYENARAFPISFAIVGEYNDYGGIENIEPSPVHEVTKKVLGVDGDLEEYINDEVERGNAATSDKYNKNYSVGLWMARKGVYDALVQPKHVEYYVKEYVEAVRRAKAGPLAKFRDSADELAFNMDVEYELGQIFDATGGFQKRNHNPAYVATASGFAGNNMSQVIKAREHFHLASDDVLPDLVRAVCYRDELSGIIHRLRRTWLCGSGAGSQSVLYSVHYKYAEVYAAEVESIMLDNYAELDYDDDDWFSRENPWEPPAEIPKPER